MARKANSSAQATKKNILTQAQLLFSAHGLDGVSVRDIATQSNVNVALISHYFGGKQGLYDSCIDALYHEISAVRPLLIQRIQRGSPTPALLSSLITDAYQFARLHQGSLRLLQRDILQKGYFDPQRRDHQLLPFLAAFASIFPERPAPQLRFGLQSLIFLIVRYALCTPEELALLAPNQTQAALIEHLTSLAQSILFPTLNTNVEPA